MRHVLLKREATCVPRVVCATAQLNSEQPREQEWRHFANMNNGSSSNTGGSTGNNYRPQTSTCFTIARILASTVSVKDYNAETLVSNEESRDGDTGANAHATFTTTPVSTPVSQYYSGNNLDQRHDDEDDDDENESSLYIGSVAKWHIYAFDST